MKDFIAQLIGETQNPQPAQWIHCEVPLPPRPRSPSARVRRCFWRAWRLETSQRNAGANCLIHGPNVRVRFLHGTTRREITLVFGARFFSQGQMFLCLRAKEIGQGTQEDPAGLSYERCHVGCRALYPSRSSLRFARLRGLVPALFRLGHHVLCVPRPEQCLHIH